MQSKTITMLALLLLVFIFSSSNASTLPQDPIETLKQRVKQNPESPELHYNLGVAYHRANRLEEAAQAYSQAGELQPDFYPAFFNLGVIRASQGRFAEAEKLFVRVQEIAPNFTEVQQPLAAARLFLRADTALKEKRFDTAASLFQEYLGFNPGDPHGEAGLKEAQRGQKYAKALEAERGGNWAEAVRIYEQMDSSYADVRSRLAAARRRLRPDTTARPPKTEPPIAATPKPPAEPPELVRNYEAGVRALERGDYPAAIAALNAVVETDPDFRDAAGRLRRARGLLSNEVRKRYERGISHLERKELRAAEASFKQTLALDARHLGARAGRLVVAGWQALEDGNATEARVRAQAALQLVNGFSPARLLLRAAEDALGTPTVAKESGSDTAAMAETGPVGEAETAEVLPESETVPVQPGGTPPWLIWVPVAGGLVLAAGLAFVFLRRRTSQTEPQEAATPTAPYVSGEEVADQLLAREPTPAFSPHAPDLRTGTVVSRYQIQGEVGRGAMGVVYKAWDPQLDRTVVLKTIRFDALSDVLAELSDVKQRFFREARAAGRLNHPNIVTVYDVAEEKQVWFIVMEYLEGETLSQALARERVLSVQRATRMMKQVCSALDYAHSNGVIHRDIKPSNIMVLKGDQIKVMDFGIAKLSASTMTSTGSLIGTASYMSPEQISGQQINGRSDIFSAGIVLYELITGQRPFQGETIPTLMYEILNHEPTLPTKLNPSISPVMDEIIKKALAKDPDQRYSSAEELYSHLDRAEQGHLIEAILVVDICDSSRIAEKYGNRYAERLFDRFRTITNESLQRHRPSFVKDTGDGVMATFGSARDAVLAAVDFEQGLARHNQSVSAKEGIHTRVGIHFGETRVAGSGDRHSADVNVAFRVQGLSQEEFIEESGGLKRSEVPEKDRIFITQQLYEELAEAGEFPTRPIGFFEMKNIYGRHRIYEVQWQANGG